VKCLGEKKKCNNCISLIVKVAVYILLVTTHEYSSGNVFGRICLSVPIVLITFESLDLESSL